MLVSPVSVANVRTPGMNRNSRPSFGSETVQGGSLTPDPVGRVLEAEKDAFAERMSKQHKVPKKVIMIVLAALLTAGVAFSVATGYIQNLFGAGSANVPPDVPGIVEQIPGHTDDTPGFTIPSEKPGETEKPGTSETQPPETTEKPFDLSAYPKPNWPTDYDETLEYCNNDINKRMGWSQLGGIDNVLENTQQKYGKYLHEYLTNAVVGDAIKSSFVAEMYDMVPAQNGNPANITPDAFKQVNDFLIVKGEKPLTDINDPEQSIAALWIAINLNYNPEIASLFSDESLPNLPDDPYIQDLRSCKDLAMAVGLAKCLDTTSSLGKDGEMENYVNRISSAFASIFPSLRPR